jgi:hypothetical protein
MIDTREFSILSLLHQAHHSTGSFPRSYGWCYLGDRGNDSWRTRYVDFPGQDVPQSGSIVSVNFPLNVRPSMGSKDVIGVAHVGQQLRIEEVRNRDNLYWAAVSVVE